MNKDTAKDYLPLVQALADGKVIQISTGEGFWTDIPDPNFGIHPSDYRIKPEPREIWVNQYRFSPDTVHFNRQSAENMLKEDGITRRYREVIE